MTGSTKTHAGPIAQASSGLLGALATWGGPLFTNRLFRALWLANLASDFGYWMNSVGASWTMTDLSVSPLLNTCIQASTTLPMFLLALPSGALAFLDGSLEAPLSRAGGAWRLRARYRRALGDAVAPSPSRLMVAVVLPRSRQRQLDLPCVAGGPIRGRRLR